MATKPARRKKGIDGAAVDEKAQVKPDDHRDIDARIPRIVNLRAARLSWRQIAAETGLNHETCRKWYRQEMKRVGAALDESLDEHRADLAQSIELVAREMLATMLGARGTQIAVSAAGRVLQALGQYADLFGLNSPVKVIVDDVRRMDDPELIAAELREILEAAERAAHPKELGP